MKNAVIVAYGRSAIGKAGRGSLRNTRPEHLGGQVLKGVLDKVPQLKDRIEDLTVGCSYPEGEQGGNMARIVGALAGLSYEVPAQTINRFCSSGLQSIATAANSIMAGQSEIQAAGGVESMSTVPQLGYMNLPDPQLIDSMPEYYMSMGHTAERVAEAYNVSRTEQDEFAAKSHQKAHSATESGAFEGQIIKVAAIGGDGKTTSLFTRDEGIRPQSTAEVLGNLKPVFKKDGTVTAGNSSQLSDGAGFVVMMEEELAKSMGIKPIARFVGFAVAGVQPQIMGIGPIYAIPKALKTAGLTIEDIDLIELNEAFASQAIACIKTLKLNTDIVNVNGGAIAMGHPLGGTGAILTAKLLHELERRNGKYGLVSMCIGGGQGAAGIFERLP